MEPWRFPGPWTSSGPMCRTAEDCGIVLQTIAGKDDNDPGTAGRSFYFAPQFQKDPEDDPRGLCPAILRSGRSPPRVRFSSKRWTPSRAMGVTSGGNEAPGLPVRHASRER